jgi:hypothetical protein
LLGGDLRLRFGGELCVASVVLQVNIVGTCALAVFYGARARLQQADFVWLFCGGIALLPRVDYGEYDIPTLEDRQAHTHKLQQAESTRSFTQRWHD